jgi:hypothetical protein
MMQTSKQHYNTEDGICKQRLQTTTQNGNVARKLKTDYVARSRFAEILRSNCAFACSETTGILSDFACSETTTRCVCVCKNA